MKVVLDTSVLVAGWRSRNGASHLILREALNGVFRTVVSVPLVMEYEEVLARHLGQSFGVDDVRVLVDALCLVAERQPIFFLWRPFLRDVDDDMVLEVAVAASADAIVTHNTRDFAGTETFGIAAWTPGEFLIRLRGAL